jgi:hypothetical protein
MFLSTAIGPGLANPLGSGPKSLVAALRKATVFGETEETGLLGGGRPLGRVERNATSAATTATPASPATTR